MNETKVLKLSQESEDDIIRKSGKIQLVVVFKEDEGYDLYHPSHIPHLIRHIGERKNELHRGKDIDMLEQTKSESDLLLTDGEDAELTEIETCYEEIDFSDIIKKIECITYVRSTKFICCIPTPVGPFYC